MKRINYLLLMFLTAIGASAAKAPISVSWEMGENGAKPNKYSSTFTITNVSSDTLQGGWEFYYNVFSRKLEQSAEAPAVISEPRRGYFCITPSKYYKPLAPGESMSITFLTNHSFLNTSYAPDGGHFVASSKANTALPVKIERPAMTREEQWSVPDKPMPSYPSGENVYAKNSKINPVGAKLEGSIYNILPTPKNITPIKGSTKMLNEVAISAPKGLEKPQNYLSEKLTAIGIHKAKSNKVATKIALSILSSKNDNPEYYEIKIDGKGINIAGSTPTGVLNGVKTFLSVLNTNPGISALPNVTIKDYPDLFYRGMMLDISRNFTKYENIKNYIDLLAQYKINKFHFHFSDDEAWRLEINGLPELTEVGSKKGFTRNENDFLIQTYSGTGDPNDTTTSANGHLTRTQFIDLLKYADTLGIEIIPEIESPGHARAAIVSMKARYNKYKNTDLMKAEEYKIWDPNDSSVYTSAQGYMDNVLCVASEGTYKFMEKVVDELSAMYKDAGINLNTIHIGGDEVPHGSWEKSPAVRNMMAEKGMDSVKDAGEYFIDRVSQMIINKGIKVGGWQEVALNHSDEYNKNVSHRFSGINVWSTTGKNDVVPYNLANAGYPVIMCNVSNYYLDMIYNRHQDEPGLNWGGQVDEFASWYSQPFNIYRSTRIDTNDKIIDLATAADGKPELKNKSNIIGVQGQLWAETIRNYDMVQYLTYPKIFGLMERGWNVNPAWADEHNESSIYDKEIVQYNLKIGEKLLPALNRKNINFHLGQPGIIIKDGMLIANAQYPGVEIRYTIDGTEPTKDSPKWTKPVACDSKLVKAKSFYLGKESLTTFLFVK